MKAKCCIFFVLLATWLASVSATGAELSVEIEQITFGPRHHFTGYIGHVRTIPWNQSGRYIVALQTEFQDHLPLADEAANIVLIDTHDGNRVQLVDKTRAWNFQQGTMLYWNPDAPETQFFLNDRDPNSGKVFCALFDISRGQNGQRIREFRYPDTPVGNSGVAQNGGYFLGLNYGRLARLRPVTGYPEAHDWTHQVNHPIDDGIFKINVATKAKELLVSYKQLEGALRERYPGVDHTALFINHTLWNRDDDRIYFYARGNFGSRERRIDAPFTIRPDGTGLTLHALHIGGHPEWEQGPRIIGSHDDHQVVYDTDRQEIVERIGSPEIFPKPGGDVALSPDAHWLANGYSDGGQNFYVLFHRSDGAYVRTRGLDRDGWTSGPLRIDPGPCWNRDSTKLLVPAVADDPQRTRQLFLITVKKDENSR